MGARLAIALLAVLAAGPPAQDGAAAAAAALAEAERHAREGHYERARREYARIAERYPGTDAAASAARRSTPSAFVGWRELVQHGPSANRVDVCILGEGYQLGEQDQFDDLAEDVPGFFARERTLREYYEYFNFTRVNLISADNGVDGFGRDYDTALGGFTTETFAGHVGIDRRLVYRALDELPDHDRLGIVFVKLGVAGTASAGIATIGHKSIRTIIHEWGHAFGRLGDEYATKTHERGKPGKRVNVSITENPFDAPWAHWLSAKVPGVGLYEGASGQVRDVWRPTASGCTMNDGEFFCRVCQEALVLAIYRRVDPIDSCYPPAPRSRAGLLLRDDPLELEVKVLQPAKHELEVQWWLDPAALAPSTPAGELSPELEERLARKDHGDRRDRGFLPAMTSVPYARTRPDPDGVHTLTLLPWKLEPGRYRLTCRVRDTTKLRGERWPWVLRDEHGLLESERAWWLVVLERR